MKGGTERCRYRGEEQRNECEKRLKSGNGQSSTLYSFLLRERERVQKKCSLLRYYLKMTKAAPFPPAPPLLFTSFSLSINLYSYLQSHSYHYHFFISYNHKHILPFYLPAVSYQLTSQMLRFKKSNFNQ